MFHFDIPRRIALCYLLYSSALTICFALCGLWIARSARAENGEPARLTELDPALLAEGIRWAGEAGAWWILLGPLACVVAGAVHLWRLARPVAGIEAQLRRVAEAASVAEAPLAELTVRGPATFGWNRLVEECRNRGSDTDFKELLSDAIGSVRRRQADEILHSLPDGVAVTDEAGRITFANHALAAMAEGISPSESLDGGTIESCFQLEDQPEAAGALLAPDSRVRPVVTEIEQSGQSGMRRFRVARHPLRAGGSCSQPKHVWSIRDISQQKAVERMRDQFLDTATHELRTPLANIRAYAETLSLDKEIDTERQKEFFNTINAEATRLARLVDDLLDISSIEVGAPVISRRETDISRLLTEVVGKVASQMEQKGIALKTSFPEKWPTLSLDKEKVTASLVNLLGNAAKYTPEGGRVSLLVKVSERHLQVAVQDTGVGISEEELPRVFDRFFRSADSRVQTTQGSGLGLSLAHKVACMHNGTLEATSELDQGSTFTLTLPLGAHEEIG